MAREKKDGNMVFYCPACHTVTQVSVIIGMQPYVCLKMGMPVSVQAQQQSFRRQGWEIIEGKEKLVNGTEAKPRRTER